MYFKYKIQNTYIYILYIKYVFQILVFEILPSTASNASSQHLFTSNQSINQFIS